MINGEIADGQFNYDIIDLNDQPLFSTPDQNVYTGLHNEANIELPDVSEGAQIFHDYKAFEVFNADGSGWGVGILGESMLSDLKSEYIETGQPFAECTDAADVFAIVNDPETDSLTKQLLNETAAKYRSNVYAAKSSDGNHFANTTGGYYVILDDQKVAESATVVPDANDATHGVAMFQNMRLVIDSASEDATYYFAVHERKPVDQQGVDYDSSYTYFKVYVKKVNNPDTGEEFLLSKVSYLIDNGSGDPKTMLVDGEKKNLTFTNELILYTLPATGGTGTVPYILFGAAMVSGAFILLIMRRKKEVMR
jgi:LPXTG-motif cell wall-anchored protein